MTPPVRAGQAARAVRSGSRLLLGGVPFANRKNLGMGDVIKIAATVDLSVSPPEVRIEPVAGDPWKDYGYWLEAVAVMAQYAPDSQGFA